MDRQRGSHEPSNRGIKRLKPPPAHTGPHLSAHQSRPETVPPLWTLGATDLTIHSTPLPLTTRSLTSSRSSSRLATGVKKKQRKDTSRSSKIKTSRPITQPLESTSTPDLTIRSAREPRPLSPDLDKFMLDLNSVLRSPPPSSPQSCHDNTFKSRERNRERAKPTVAARFDGGRGVSDPRLPGVVDGRVASTVNNGDGVPEHSLSPSPTDDSRAAVVDARQDGSRRRGAAAVSIQRWYRRLKGEQVTRELVELLQEKKDELHRSKMEEQSRAENEAAVKWEQEAEVQRRRVAKMQAVRKAAIEELQRKREEKRLAAERIAQEEIALLQSSGKIKKKRSRKGRKELEVGDHVGAGGGGAKDEELGGAIVKSPAPDLVIDEFFEAGNARQHGLSTQHTDIQQEVSCPPTVTQATTTTTHTKYDDILETLKQLEAEPAPLDPSGASSSVQGEYLCAQNISKLKEQVQSDGGKLQAILSYLDEVEQADANVATQSASAPVSTKKTPSLLPTGTSGLAVQQEHTPRHLSDQLEAATALASDVTTTITAQRLELDNKQKTIEMLQKALHQQRELTVYHAKEMDKEGQRRLELQKQEYEETIQRHQTFIDQLIDNKKVLSERCATLVAELKEMDGKYKHKIKSMEESHVAELSKVKQVSAAADKLRREKWRAEESQRIKQATVKGLEPEIQRIIAKGKAEIQKLKALHEAELLQADERASRRFIDQMEEIRAQCAQEKEVACTHERELARQRYEKLAEQEEMNYQQQRRKLFLEVQQEKDKLFASVEQQRAELEKDWREREDAHRTEIEEMRAQHNRAMEEAQRRHNSELRALEERLTIERDSWEENYRRRQEVVLMDKEREMKEAVREERDKEIEMVISRLESETAESKAECERAAESRIKRIREKYETELREVERSERTTMERFNTMRGELTERESELAHLKVLLRQKEAEVEQVTQVATKLTQERDNVTDVVRQEFADRLVSTEEENRRLKVEMSELRARHRLELERVSHDKDREMEEVYSRVRQALAKKEENLNGLRVQHEAALKRADHLEMLLERQRKELLRK